MKLLAKFNLIFIVVFGVGWVVAGYLANRFLQDNARAQVEQQAQLMMETASSMRSYTTKQVKPLLQREQIRSNVFLPQTVPAYAATTSFDYLRKTYPDYTYKEATLNPTNLRDRAEDWEADIVNNFRNHHDQKMLIGDRETPTGRSLFLARPISADPPCLECHSTAARAPRAMIRLYGSTNGFGWKPNEIIGAQIVSVPMSLPVSIANKAFYTVLIYIGVLSLLTLIIFDLAVVMIVIRPVQKLSATADKVSKGDLDVPEIPVRGKDEIADLTASFNRMYLSLVKALRLLEE
ncbi:MAG TPA: DUF3365 domain-containing protein [Bryobacteraceae bacterium]|nr:DUF3365 domain-containing protein [Bryobacteraceae bacterium]